MGAWLRLGEAVACAAILCWAARSGASTVVEPIARLYLEGGYDSNARYGQRNADGTLPNASDRTARLSPDLGLHLRNPLWDLRATYGGDYLYYERFQPGGTWNHRGVLQLRARPTERTTLDGTLYGSWAFDPVGLAQAGVFEGKERSALLVRGRFRAEWRATRRVDLAGTLREEAIVFSDRTGGAMHAPGVEALWRQTPRLSVGGALSFGVFQTFDPVRGAVATSEGVRARARYRLTRRFTVDASAGPALWSGSDTSTAVVPEGMVELVGVSPRWDLRLAVGHALGIGYTAQPGLVNSFEFGGERRFVRRYFLRSSGGIWQSGVAPTGSGAVTGYAVVGEAGAIVREDVRISVVATHLSRMDHPSPEFTRTTVGLRLGWELPVR